MPSSRGVAAATFLVVASLVVAGVALGVAATLDSESSASEPAVSAGVVSAGVDTHGPAMSDRAAPRSAFYVSPSGSDQNPGTEARPWRTIQRGVRALRPGQTLFVKDGVYPEVVTLSRSGTRAKRITVRAFPGHRPVINGEVVVTGDYVRLAGFVIDGSGGARADGIGISILGSEGAQIVRDEVRNAPRSGIFVGQNSSEVQILRSWIHHNGSRENLDHGIYWSSNGPGLIANNIVEANRARGIQLYPNADGVLVAYNTVVANGRIGIIVGGDGTNTADRNSIVNNIVALNGEYGIRSGGSGPAGQGNIAQTNVVFGHPDGDLGGPFTAGIEFGSDNIVADPRFVDPEAGDWRLLPDSPAIDHALPDVQQSLDFVGQRRPQGAGADIGAYEVAREPG